MIAHMKSELTTCAQVQAMHDRFIGFLDDLDKKLSDAGSTFYQRTFRYYVSSYANWSALCSSL